MRGRENRRRSFGLAIPFLVIVVLLSGSDVTVQDRNQPLSPAQVRRLLDEGRYDEAESGAAQLVSATVTEFGAESVNAGAAADLLVEALWRNGKAADSSVRGYADRALQARQAHYGNNSPQLVPSLRGLAHVLVAAGDLNAAIPLFERSVDLLQAQRASDPEIAEALDDLAEALIVASRYDDAGRALRRAVSIQEMSLGPNHLAVARTLELLAKVSIEKADYARSHPFLQQALAIRGNASPEHPALANVMRLLGDLAWYEGDSLAAQRSYRSALAVAERTLRPDHPEVASLLRNLANTMFELGDLTEGRSLQERALSIAERSYGPSNPALAEYLNDLAVIVFSQADFSQARALWERAIEVISARRGANDVELGTYLFNLGVLHRGLGDFVEARRWLERASRVWQAGHGAEHPHVARAMSARADVFIDEGRYADALPLLERALGIREKYLGADHPSVAWSLTVLATTLAHQQRLARANDLSTRAVGIWERSGSPNTPRFASVLESQADLQANQGYLLPARRYYEEALAIRAEVFGRTHPLFADAQTRLAAVLVRLGESDSALDSALQAEETRRRSLRLTLPYLPERQSLSLATVASRPDALNLALSLSASDARRSGQVFDALIQSRALVLDEMGTRQQLSTDAARADFSPLWAALVSSRQRLANLVVRGPNEERPDQYTALLEEARREEEQAERVLAEKSAVFKSDLTRHEVGLTDVQAALGADSALVAFVRYNRTPIDHSAVPGGDAQLSSTSKPSKPVPSYMAFAVHAGSSGVAVVPLGPASVIDALVAGWRQETTGILQVSSAETAIKNYRSAGVALRRRVWDPLRKYLEGVETVFIVADGTLNLVSFAALPVGQSSYVIDRGPVIHYLSAERDLVPIESSTKPSQGLLALGGAAFNDASLFAGTSKPAPASVAGAANTNAVASLRAVSSEPLRAGCGTLQSMQFTPLAGTSREVREVAALWTESPAQVLEGRGATEQVFKREAPGHRVLHLATHGFFLGNDCTPVGAATRSVGGLAAAQAKSASRPRPTGPRNAALSENPLLMSGLALAGANRRAAAGPDEDDGILTAEEVTALNLDGVEWAVLSACDTGLGEVKAGEGVFGLRRAFQVAGVRTVIMSLWPVDDQATRIWMRALYQGRLQKRLSTADAMHEASLSVLRARRTRGESTHPFYWAAFVAAGDWR